MRSQLWIAVFTFSVSFQAAVASSGKTSVKCSTADAQLTFSFWQDEDGRRPLKGTVIGESLWTYKGKVLDKQVRKAEEPSERTDLDASRDPDTQVELHVELTDADRVQREIHAVKMNLARKSGKPVFPDSTAKRMGVYMICESLRSAKLRP